MLQALLCSGSYLQYYSSRTLLIFFTHLHNTTIITASRCCGAAMPTTTDRLYSADRGGEARPHCLGEGAGGSGGGGHERGESGSSASPP